MISDEPIERVYIVGYWWSGNEAKPDEPGEFRADGAPNTRAALQLGLTREIVALRAAGKAVVLFADPPRFRFNPRRAMLIEWIPARAALKSITGGRSAVQDGRVAIADVVPITGMDDAAREASLASGAAYVDLRPRFCSPKDCRIAGAGMEPLYLDQHHLSRAGSLIAILPPPAAAP